MDHSGDAANPHLGDEGEAKPKAGTALVPYAPTIEAPPRHAPQPAGRGFLNLVFRATLAAGFLALLWLGASQLLPGRMPVATVPGPAASAGPAPGSRGAESGSLREAVEALGALKAEVDGLRASIARREGAIDPSLTDRLDGFTASLDRTRTEMRNALAELAEKLEPAGREAAARLQHVAERLDRIERQLSVATSAAVAAPASPPPKAVAPKAALQAETAEPRRPQVIRNWVVRGVYDGFALVEGAAGAFEVAPGAVLPGAGRVKAIERRGTGWIVITSRGVIDEGRGPFLR